MYRTDQMHIQNRIKMKEKKMENNSLTDAAVYPQFQTQAGGGTKSTSGITTTESQINTGDSSERFCSDGAVHNRLCKILKAERNGNRILLTVETAAKESHLANTHETALYLCVPAVPTIETLYVQVELWAENIFRVKMSESQTPADPFAGLPEEGKMLIGKPESINFSVEETEENIQISTSKMTITIEKETCRISARDKEGTQRFCQRKDTFQAADVFDSAVTTFGDETACFEALELDSDEVIYGLGERFDSIIRNGRTVDFHNKDAVGTTSRRTYVNVPFFMSTRGYGLFLNAGAPTSWQIATKDMSALQFSVLDDQMDYFVIISETPKEILKGYCSLTGFSKLPPLWSFGLWMSRNSYTSWEVMDDIAKQVRENDIPCDVLHLDTAWFSRDWNCDLKFSKERFPDPEKHIRDYAKDGFHISLWQYNYIPPNEDNENYHEAVQNGYLVKDENGSPYQLPETCKGSWVDDVIIDFSNPEARKWYGEKIYELIKMGACAIKTDFGEGIPENAHYDKIDGKHFHNLYSLIYNATIFEATKEASGENIVWARSGTAGSQRYPLHWGGDSQCTFDALAGTLRAALSIGMSGIPFFSHDIGGFIGLPNDELYVRWAQMGLFSSHSRCHGAGNHTHREPWNFSDEACRIFRKYDKLRYSLMPYIYEQAEKCTATGLPMMRALYLEYPEDRNVWHIEDEYLFGDNLLIAPVLKPLSRTNIREIYLPKGTWFDYFTKEKIVSDGKWIKRTVDLETMPIYVKEGTVLKYCSADRTLQNGMGEITKTELWK